MSGRRNSRGTPDDSPAGSRRSRGRAAAGAGSPATSEGIAPLPEPSPSQQGPRGLGTINEDSPPAHNAAAPSGSLAMPTQSGMRSPSVGLLRAVRSPDKPYSQGPTSGMGRTPGGGRTTPGTGKGTRAHRPDLGAAPIRPMVTIGDVDIPDIDQNNGSSASNTVIWGTNINAEALSSKVDRFLWNFKDQETAEDKYMALIRQAGDQNSGIVNLDTEDLRASDRTLYNWLISYPHEVLPIFDFQGKCKWAENNGVAEDDPRVPDIQFHPFNLELKKTIRDLNPTDIDRMICIEGMVTRTSNVIPDLRLAHFVCAKCNNVEQRVNEGGRVDEPLSCVKCHAKSMHTLVHNLCAFSNKQLVKMQEKPNDIPEGETPHAVTLHAYQTNVDVCRPGDRVTVTGILRALPMRVNPMHRALHATFKTYIDVMHVHRDEASRLFSLAASRDQAEQKKQAEELEKEGPGSQGQAAPPSQSGITGVTSQVEEPAVDHMDTADMAFDSMADQMINLGNETHDQVRAKEARIRELSRDPKIMQRLVASLAPNVWEMEDVKKGLLCQLFGGSGKTFPGGRIRGELNLLLVGDPSVSKSQLLSYVHALAPRGIYTSGKGSSAVGLTAYVTRDPETREMVLESGALVLSDRGICCIDEFDKMSESARSMLHEAMEQQTVSVAKAGLISTLNARTSVCACANPIGSRYNSHLTLAENINLPPTLLTRFDLIYLVLDKCEEERDRRLARHLVSLFHEHVPVRPMQEELEIPKELLKDYIAFARTRVNPKLSEAAVEELVSAYGTLRQDGRDRKVVVATPRQLESLIRLSESLARMRLSEVVGKPEVEEAVRLWYTAMQGSASDGNDKIDMDNIFTGASTAARQAQEHLPDELKAILLGPAGRAISLADLQAELQRTMAASGKSLVLTKQQVLGALKQMEGVVSFDERTGIVRPRGGAGRA